MPADVMTEPVATLDAPTKWGQMAHVRGTDPVERAWIAQGARQARRHLEEGYTTDELRRELKRSKRNRALVNLVIALAVIALIVAAAAFAITLLFSVNKVESSEMAPLLKQGQVLLVDENASLNSNDVFAYNDGSSVRYSRVVAVPGKWVNIMSDGSLLVSDEQLETSYPRSTSETGIRALQSRQIPEGFYYALGDAEEATVDGLMNGTDFVPVDWVVGKPVLKVWPLG